jgi:Raf kinase inhibitor-like YbhB/YbcL family protein
MAAKHEQDATTPGGPAPGSRTPGKYRLRSHLPGRNFKTRHIYIMNRTTLPLAGLAGLAVALFAQAEPKIPAASASLTVTSSAFPSGGSIPAKYSCEGANVSPALEWSGIPAKTKSLALICEDPDAPTGTWTHWVLFNLPASTTTLPEKMDTAATLSSGAKQGTNDFQKTGYGGPCPPPGKPHRYFFKIYALDTELALKPDATRNEVLRAMEHHIVAEGQLMGTYQRKK